MFEFVEANKILVQEQANTSIIPSIIQSHQPEIVYHSKSCYTSKKFDYLAKLNEILAQDELSNKIIIPDNYNDDKNSNYENLGMYKSYYCNIICI